MSIGPSPSGNLSGVSEFLFRGISGAGLQEGIEHGCAEARYIGARSNINSLADMSTAEAQIPGSLDIDGYPGRRRPLDDACKLDSGFQACFYPGGCARYQKLPYTTENSVGFGGAILSLKYSRAMTNVCGRFDSRHGDDIDACANREFGPGWLLNGRVGRQRIPNTDRASCSDWKLGITGNSSMDSLLRSATTTRTPTRRSVQFPR